MMPLYEDPWFTIRFADDRIIERIHLEGIGFGTSIILYSIDPTSGARLKTLATATTDADGWVQLPHPLIVQAGDTFIAVPYSPPFMAGNE